MAEEKRTMLLTIIQHPRHHRLSCDGSALAGADAGAASRVSGRGWSASEIEVESMLAAVVLMGCSGVVISSDAVCCRMI